MGESVAFSESATREPSISAMTWNIEPHPEGAIVRITDRDVPVGISPEDPATGLASTLANLKDFVSR